MAELGCLKFRANAEEHLAPCHSRVLGGAMVLVDAAYVMLGDGIPTATCGLKSILLPSLNRLRRGFAESRCGHSIGVDMDCFT